MYHMNITHGTGHANDATARAKLAMLSVWDLWYILYVYMHIKFHLRSIFGLQQYFCIHGCCMYAWVTIPKYLAYS